jgi:hypothetical protein
MTDIIPSSLIDINLAEQQLALAKKCLLWNRHKALLFPIITALVEQGIEPHYKTDDISIEFTGDAAKLRDAMAVIVDADFSTTFAPAKPGDTMWYGWFTREDCPIKLWVHFTSSVCTRKKIGTKMIEQDVYETICGDCTTESMQLPAPAPVLNHEALPF